MIKQKQLAELKRLYKDGIGEWVLRDQYDTNSAARVLVARLVGYGDIRLGAGLRESVEAVNSIMFMFPLLVETIEGLQTENERLRKELDACPQK